MREYEYGNNLPPPPPLPLIRSSPVISRTLPESKNEWRMPLIYNKLRQNELDDDDINRLSTSILPSEENRTPDFINPYALVSRNPRAVPPAAAIQNSGWNLGFRETFKYDFPHPRFSWNRNKELFVGPPANKYPPWSSLPSFKEQNKYPENINAMVVWGAPGQNANRANGLNYDYQFGVSIGAAAPEIPAGREQLFPEWVDVSPHRRDRRITLSIEEKKQNVDFGGWKGGNKTLKKKRKTKKNKSLKKKRKSSKKK